MEPLIKIKSGISRWSSHPAFYWVLFIVVICSFILGEYFYPNKIYPAISILGKHLGISIEKYLDPELISETDIGFSINFIEWFGVLYGFLIAQVLVKVWEQFDIVDRTFDSEADAIKILYEDLQLLEGKEYIQLKIDVLSSLSKYINHTIDYHSVEHEKEFLREDGNRLLVAVRQNYRNLMRRGSLRKSKDDLLFSEFLQQINSIIDLRGDRISYSRERLFQVLKVVSIITSVLWLLPFFFVKYNVGDYNVDMWVRPGMFAKILMFGVTFLVILVLTIIEDLDNPFGGIWSVKIDPWKQLKIEIDSLLADLVPAGSLNKNARKRIPGSHQEKEF